MPIIPGVDVDYSGSPRIITIPISLTEISMQDLHDTLRDIEDFPTNMKFSPLIDSEGKKPVNVAQTEFTGITVTLQNALLKFADRPGPSTILCVASGGNLTATDAVGTFVYPVAPSTFVSPSISQSSSPTSLDIDALTPSKLFAILNM